MDLSLPAIGMVEIIDKAVPGVRPIRPNKPLNIAVGLVAGGLAGGFLATLVYLLQLRAFRRLSSGSRTQYPPQLRAAARILIALFLGLLLGYQIAVPLTWFTLIGLPLCFLFGGGALAYIEFAKPSIEPTARVA